MSGDAAFKISQAVMRTVIGIWAGPLAGVAESASDALFAKAKSDLDQRRIRRFYDECADTVAERMGKFITERGVNLPANERQAAVDAVTRTLDAAEMNNETVIVADLDAAGLESLVESASGPVLERAALSDAGRHFYRILLRESCAYVVETVKALPEFVTDAAVELLKRSTAILETQKAILARMPSGTDDDDGFAQMYRRSVVSKFDHLELFGAALSNETSRRYQLDIAYIGLTALDLGQLWGLRRGGHGGDAERSGAKIEQLLARGSRHLLIGEAGSGKTTCLQWLAVTAARQVFEPPIGKWNETIPFLIPLRRFAAGPLPKPGEFLEEAGRNISEKMSSGWVHQYLETGRALLLIDGVDELPEAKHAEAIRWLTDLVREFPECRFVVTSRPGAITDEWARLTGFNYARLEDMRPEDIRTFIDQWHRAVRHSARDQAERERLDGDCKALLDLIDSDRHMRALCINPLLCALLCALNREYDRALPRNRMGVYEAALRLLMDLRDQRRTVPDPTGLTFEQKVTVLQDLAFYLFMNGLSDAPVDQAVQRVSEVMRHLPASPLPPRELLTVLVKRSGLLRHPIEDRVDFIHKTFQEYLAGKAAVEKSNIGYLVKNADDEQFRAVIVMAAAHAQPSQRMELFDGIMRRITRPGAHTDLKLLLLASLQISPSVDPDHRSRIEMMVKDLIPPDYMADVPAIAAAGTVVLELLAERPPANTRQAAASIRLAAAVGGPESLRTITDITTRFEGLEDELVRAWSSQVGAHAMETFGSQVMAPFGSALPPGKRRLMVDEGSLLPFLPTLAWLEELILRVPSLTSLKKLPPQPAALRRLHIEEHSLADYSGIERWNGLTGLFIDVGGQWIDEQPLLQLTELRVLRMRYLGSKPISLSFLDGLPKLESAQLLQPNARGPQRTRTWSRATPP